MSLTKLEYRVWRQADPMQPGGEILEMKSHVTMADYHFRVNAERAGIDPRGITTEVHWTGDAECRFAIAADAPSETLSRAWEKSVALLGLRTELAAEATQLEKLTGVFDNKEAMQREAWIEGKKVNQWPAAWCADGLVTVMPWERKVLERPWGSYPDLPPESI